MTVSKPTGKTAGTLDVSDPRQTARFIRANTKLLAPPLVPEILLHLAEESVPIWQKSEEELGGMNVPPPYWAFAWAGGQALARYILDHNETCRGLSVLDLGSGSGMTAIAAAKAGARTIVAADIDPLALASVLLNCEANHVSVEVLGEDVLSAPPSGFDVVLVGDLFYERALAERVLGFIDQARAAGMSVLIGDPQRNYFPRGRFTAVADYAVPVTRELEDSDIKTTAVWRA